MTAPQTRRTSLAGLLAGVLLLGACATAPVPDADSPLPSAHSASASPTPQQTPRPAVSLPSDDAPADSAGSLMPPGNAALKEFQRGQASWYGPGFHGRRTANGERFDMHGMTAAHKTLPFGTLVRVRSLVTGKEIDVRVNDRGPFTGGRVIDLSRAAAEALGLLALGVKDVQLLVPEGMLSISGRSSARTVQKRQRLPAAGYEALRN